MALPDIEGMIRQNERTKAATALEEFADHYEHILNGIEPKPDAADDYWRGADDASRHAIASLRSKATLLREGHDGEYA